MNDVSIRWPNLFIVGAAKSGTTFLFSHLSDHPDVFMARRKETHFFSRAIPHPRLKPFMSMVHDPDQYLELFNGATDETYLGEASPSYLWEAQTARRISTASPDARIIIMLRDPVERAFSHYLQYVREGLEDRTFEEALRDEQGRVDDFFGAKYIELGRYCAQITRYVETFPMDQICVLFYEEFFADVSLGLQQVWDFLRLPAPSRSRRKETQALNSFARPRNEWAKRVLGSATLRRSARRVVPEGLRPVLRKVLIRPGPRPALTDSSARLLEGIYSEEVPCLEKLLGLHPPWRRWRTD